MLTSGLSMNTDSHAVFDRYASRMSISFTILGSPGDDNALLVEVNSGQAVHLLLFDCGEGCVSSLGFAQIQAIEHLFFSHLHMDHVAGFDSFFRANFARGSKPNHIWGPRRTSQIMQHRFQGFVWNLHGESPATWRVHDVLETTVETTRFELAEAFENAYPDGTRDQVRTILETPDFTVETVEMDHLTPSLAYIVREPPRTNLDAAKLSALGLKPGGWVKDLKNPPPGRTTLEIDGQERDLASLRDQLLVTVPGDSIAYLTDFLLDEAALEKLAGPLSGCRTIVCESQYRHADLELARKNHHMTALLAATIAERAGATELILFHISDRYTPDEWREMLLEARSVFENTRFFEHWNLN
jgi:ribonuclease Z